MNVVGSSSASNAMAGTDETCTEQDIRQVERFFTSLKSRVYVCPAMVNLYFTTLQDMANLGGWELHTTGFATLIMERRHNGPRIVLCLAEKGTGFSRWKDRLNHASCYKSPEKNFHTMCVSGEERKLAGLSFENERAASELLETVQAWLEEIGPDELAQAKKKKNIKRKEMKMTPPKKETISQPCMFEHITNLDQDNYARKILPSAVSSSRPTQGRQPDRDNYDTRKNIAYAESSSTEDSGLGELQSND